MQTCSPCRLQHHLNERSPLTGAPDSELQVPHEKAATSPGDFFSQIRGGAALHHNSVPTPDPQVFRAPLPRMPLASCHFLQEVCALRVWWAQTESGC